MKPPTMTLRTFHRWLDANETLKLAFLLVGVIMPSTAGMSLGLERSDPAIFVAAGGWLAFWLLSRFFYLFNPST